MLKCDTCPFVTTDGAGNAKVRMNFTEPKNFVLVRSNE